MTDKQDSFHISLKHFSCFDATKVYKFFEILTKIVFLPMFLRISFGNVHEKCYFCALEMLLSHIIHFIKITKQ